jgi:hypothetical protein
VFLDPNIGSVSLYRKIISPKNFDRKAIWPNTIWPNVIWPKVNSTESPFNRAPFDRKFILPKGHLTDLFSENDHLTESTFDKKCHLTEKNCEQGPKIHLTESFFWKWSFDQKVIWPKGHLTERSFDRMFFFEKLSFSKHFHMNGMAIGQTVFGQMVFRSNGLSVKIFRWNDISVSDPEPFWAIFF